MGMRRFSSSSFDTPRGACICVNQISKGNPDPSNYRILKYYEDYGNLLVKIKYPDCDNYEGDKILLFLNCRFNDLLVQNTIDPHFSNNEKFKSPFARFEPTNMGWVAGVTMMESLRWIKP